MFYISVKNDRDWKFLLGCMYIHYIDIINALVKSFFFFFYKSTGPNMLLVEETLTGCVGVGERLLLPSSSAMASF